MNEPAFPPAAGRKLVFLHLPKTGGTTLHHHFSEAFAPEEICPVRFSQLNQIPTATLATYRFFSGHYTFEQIRLIPGRSFVVTVLRDPVERILSTYYFWKRHRAAVVEEHNLAGPAAARSNDLLGFLRSPIPEVRDSIENTMVRYLAGGVNIDGEGKYIFRNCGIPTRLSEMQLLHRATGNLLATDVFGFTSNLGEVYAKVSLAFDMKRLQRLERLNTRTSERDILEPAVEEEITPPIRAELNRLTSLDRVLYRVARSHRQEERER
ncbi:sulfotransferase family protein [Roseomonas terrae]|jgi:hypothetical protein|uniref:Sulfotransferase family protein n=1 Tax=Neoroseomonas terrae TaxID=424799 RepID=A0ABS5EAM6_9PROT|nr:sulfotransferase family 2 domain-containing protein [Neoroseomonas terrae]MBR0648083.1 sulfotransferase family protein [Neoroseomonas terrae]